ncbi:MAG: hypothetical protein QNK16_06610 [Woeseiaceae bacterium]|nr:hypothetical protein [Woeseiaceae bacterium]
MIPAQPNLVIPYPGLRPFDEADHLLFFGRNEQTNELLMRLEDSAFVAVVGSSGSGKSSLVRAGLLPLLSDGFLFGTDNWKIAVARPVHEPYQRLARKLTAFRNDVTEAEVLRLLRSSDDGLIQAVDAVCDDSEAHVLVVIDQFEELFGFRRAGDSLQQLQNCASRDEAAAFVAMLLAAARKGGDRLRIMITMRSDFVGDCEVFLGLPQAVSQSQFLVPRLTRSQMEEAITGPSRILHAGFEPFDFEPGLITTLTNDAGDRPDQLPLLQHALMRTWKLSDRKQLTAADYTKAGRIEEALSNDADEAWKQLGKPDQELARQMFLLLCDVSREGQMTRRRPLAQEVMDVAQVDCADIERVVRVFQDNDRNFLLPPRVESISPTAILDISHEALLRQWARLGTWLKKEATSAKVYQSLAEAAERKGSLWRDEDLQHAIEWRDQNQPTETWAARYNTGFVKAMSFLKKSEQERDSELAEDEFARILGTARYVIGLLVLVLLFLDPLGLNRKIVDDFYIGSTFGKALRPHKIVVFPEKEIKYLPLATIQTICEDKESTCESDFDAALKNSGSARSHDKIHIRHAIEGRLRQIKGVILHRSKPGQGTEAKNKLLEEASKRVDDSVEEANLKAGDGRKRKVPESIFALLVSEDLRTKIELAKQKSLEWEKDGIVVFEQKKFPKVISTDLLALPKSVDVVLPRDDQSPLTELALSIPKVEGFLLKSPEKVRPILEIFRILVHLLGYFALVFSFGIIYRRLAFPTLGMAAELAPRQSALEIRWRNISRRLSEFSERFQSRRWKALFSIVFLLVALGLLGSGWPLGLILLLLAPTDVLLGCRAWARRLKAAQGILLQVGGYYALAGSAYLLIVSSADENLLRSGLLLVWNPWVLVIAGIGLVILGRRKLVQANEETVVCEPDQAPVLYLRSVEDDGQIRKMVWGARISRFFRPNDKDLLRPIFGALGPFVALRRAEELLLHIGAVDSSANREDSPQDANELMDRSVLVILQIDDRITDYFYSRLKQALQTLRSDQVLLYFSQEVGSERLSTVYENFVEATQDVFPCPLPRANDGNRVIAFNEGWRPFLCGALTRPKNSWRNLMPLLGHRLDITRVRRSFNQTLVPFFKSRNMEPSKTRLFGDGAIGLAGFPPFGFGFPAGVMMFSNLWRKGRRWAAFIGLVAPAIGIVGSLFLVLVAATYDEYGSSANEKLELDTMAFAILVLLGFSFVISGLWRRFSGREIRRHVAFGGARQSGWKTLLVLFITGSLAWGAMPFTIEKLEKNAEKVSTRLLEKRDKSQQKLEEARELAYQGNIDGAIATFQAAQELDPDIDLDPDTIEKDPVEAANRLATVWAPKHATGAPNTLKAGDFATAWASKTKDGQAEWLELEYDEAIRATAVEIHETFNPGAVNKVSVYDSQGKEVTVWEGVATPSTQPKKVFKIQFDIKFNIKRVKLYIDSPSVPGWNEIDAVGLIDAAGNKTWAARAKASSTYAPLSE